MELQGKNYVENCVNSCEYQLADEVWVNVYNNRQSEHDAQADTQRMDALLQIRRTLGMYLCPASGNTEIDAYIEDQQEGIAGHEDIVEKSTRLSVQAEIVYQICGRQQKCIDQLPPHESFQFVSYIYRIGDRPEE